MKPLYYFIALIFVSLTLFSCRRDSIPEDIHEHEEIEQITLTLKEVGSDAAPIVITYLGGKANAPLDLEAGKTYELSLDFFHRHDDHYHSMLEELIEEKDEHFISFEFAGVDLDLVRLPSDITRTDGEKLGLKSQWKIYSVSAPARVSIKLFHGSESVKAQSPSEAKQFGEAVGGEADVNAQIEIR